MTSETDLQRSIVLALSDNPRVRLFRNNVGEAWAGRNFTIRNGQLVAGSAHRIKYGLAVGSSDLIGWRSITITPEMAGSTIAAFTAIEVKTARGRTTEEQTSFLSIVRDMGGLSGIARSTEQASEIVTQFTGYR